VLVLLADLLHLRLDRLHLELRIHLLHERLEQDGAQREEQEDDAEHPGEGAVRAEEGPEDLVPDPHDPGNRVVDVVQGPEVERHAADLPIIGSPATDGGASGGQSVPTPRCSAAKTVVELPAASRRSPSPECRSAPSRATSSAWSSCRWNSSPLAGT